MPSILTDLNAGVGVSLWLPNATEPTVRFGLTENSYKRTKQRVVTPTDRSYSSIPAFSKAYNNSWYKWELNHVCYQIELLAMEDLITTADALLLHPTQQYLILYDYSGWIDITNNPQYVDAVINPTTNQTIEGRTYAQCAHNVYVESFEVDATYSHLEALCSFTLVLSEVI